MIPPFNERPKWLKGRGYMHITPKIDVFDRYGEFFTKVTNEAFVEKHAFLPLIHSVMAERKYKKHPISDTRSHTHKIKGKFQKTVKLRPLHYATHIDALIFGYYASKIQEVYERKLEKNEKLSECIIAYRKIPVEGPNTQNEERYKGTIQFAREAFKEIEYRAKSDCVVLMFDIKSFFSSINHEKLKKAWCELIEKDRLSKAEYKVFKAATDFRYILKDDLRLKTGQKGRRSGFDERKLNAIRRDHGMEAFYSSVAEFKQAIKNKEITVYKHPFVKRTLVNGTPHKHIVGIPQGLPISAILANLYLLDFDKSVFKTVVEDLKGFYRRYSDDILIVCKLTEADVVEAFIKEEIKKSLVDISEEKTEKYLFKKFSISTHKQRITSILLGKNKSIIGKPLTYLGFEYYGDKILIKSSNLSKFYRRIIYTVKRKSKVAKKRFESSQDQAPIIFKSQLRKIYRLLDLDAQKAFSMRKKFEKGEDGKYNMLLEPIKRKHNSNYFSYTNQVVEKMSEPLISRQIRSHTHIFNSAMARHLRGKRA